MKIEINKNTKIIKEETMRRKNEKVKWATKLIDKYIKKQLIKFKNKRIIIKVNKQVKNKYMNSCLFQSKN